MSTFRRSRRTIDIWPGFVDALASLLMVFVFILVIFMLAQFFLTDTLAGRDKALEELRAGIDQLSDTLSLEQRKNTDLQSRVNRLSIDLEQARDERDSLTGHLASTRQRADAAERQAEALAGRLAEAERTIAADSKTIELKLTEIASLQDDITALRQVRRELEQEVGILAENLEATREQGRVLRDRNKALEARLDDERERTSLAQEEVKQREIRINELKTRIAESREALAGQRQATADAETQVRQLNNNIRRLRDEVTRLAAALDASEAEAANQKIEIRNLGRRLNIALAQEVEQLKSYRSEFFGRLREVLGEHPDIRVVGDRFLFQSELLFDSGSADIGEQGKRQLRRLADTLDEVRGRIPPDLDWILRIDGHTDRRPINTEQFPSNWELSAARALSIVRYLVEQGIPPERLAAAGFAEHHPIDNRTTAEAYSRNRRIEIKLTMP